MKKLLIFPIWIFICAGFQFLMNCSKPLDSITESGQTTTDTVVVIDTLIMADTMFCARLNSHRQEIVWMLQNQEGYLSLEFVAEIERVLNSQALMIDIDDQQFQWYPSADLRFIIDGDLEQNASIRIWSTPPHAYGQPIDICLRVRAP
ncbi:MAG: hypothetical protein V3W18_11755 [candidate division Zixibacteria bacterium]